MRHGVATVQAVGCLPARYALLVAVAMALSGCRGEPDLPPLPPVEAPLGVVPVTRHAQAPIELAASADGRLATWRAGGHVLFWESGPWAWDEGGAPRPRWRSETPLPGPLLDGRFDPRGGRFLALLQLPEGPVLVVYDVERGRELGRFSVLWPDRPDSGEGALEVVGLSGDGDYLVRSANRVFAFDPADPAAGWRARFQLAAGDCGDLALSPDGLHLLSRCADQLMLYTAGGPTRPLNTADGHATGSIRPAWSLDGTTLLAEVDGALLSWEPALGGYRVVRPADVSAVDAEAVAATAGHRRDLFHVLWNEGTVTTWDRGQRHRWRFDGGSIPSGLRAVAGADHWPVLDGCSLRWIDPVTGAQTTAVSLCQADRPRSLAWEPGDAGPAGARLRVSYASEVCELAVSPQLRLSADGGSGAVTGGATAARDRSGRYVAEIDAVTGEVHVADATGQRRLSLFHPEAGGCIGYTPRGRYVATEGTEEKIWVWVDHAAQPAGAAGWVEDVERVRRALLPPPE